jgi:hypothetical protein
MRRVSLALLVSLGVHVGIVVGAFGITAWRGLSFARNVEVVPITLESVKELPLGPPPIGSKPPTAVAIVPPRRPRVAPHKAGSLPTENRDAGAPPDARPAPEPKPTREAKPGDLQSYGPEGSRLTALLRLDRLRASPQGRAYIGPVDELLRLMPDRRRLLEGSGLDMYRDFDALLIATPNPFDDAVTFLAVRHKPHRSAAASGARSRRGGCGAAHRVARGGGPASGGAVGRGPRRSPVRAAAEGAGGDRAARLRPPALAAGGRRRRRAPARLGRSGRAHRRRGRGAARGGGLHDERQQPPAGARRQRHRRRAGPCPR